MSGTLGAALVRDLRRLHGRSEVARARGSSKRLRRLPLEVRIEAMMRLDPPVPASLPFRPFSVDPADLEDLSEEEAQIRGLPEKWRSAIAEGFQDMPPDTN